MVDSVQNINVNGRLVSGVKPATPTEKIEKADGTGAAARTKNIQGVSVDIQTDEAALQLVRNLKQQIHDDKNITLGDKGRILDDII